MKREAYIYTQVLDYLEANPGTHTTHKIAYSTGASYPAVARAVKVLTSQKRVKKKTGYGHSYLYEFKTRELSGKAVSTGDKPPVDPISASDLRDLIVHWSKNGWSPKSNTAASQVLLLFSQLHQFYWLQLDRGISVDQTDLDHLKAKLKAARDTAADFLAFFDKLLVTEELWDNKRSATFVLEGLEDPLSYIEIARTVSEVLK
jgi:hypothetical protein